MPNSIEAQGVTVEEAIQVALNQLGVTRDRVEIEILHHPRGGFLGIGARRAKVRATIREAFLADGEEYDMSSGERIGRGGRRGRRSRRRRGARGGERRDETEGGAPGRKPEQREAGRPREARQTQDGERGERRSTRGGRGRGDERQQPARPDRRGESRSRATQRDTRSEKDLRSETPTAGRPPQRDERTQVRTRTDTRERPLPAGPKEGERPDEALGTQTQPVQTPTREEVGRRAEAALGEILRRMGFEAKVSSVFEVQDGETVIKVECEAEGILIGRRGQTLDALEHVVNRIVLGGESGADVRLAIDVGGYRERRAETLRELADRLKTRALTQGRRIQVSPMSPRDRRILQEALAGDDSVRVRVLGSGFYRRVVIFPSGLDESAAPLEFETDEAGEEAPLDAEEQV